MTAEDLKYRQVLDYIYEKLPMYHLVGASAYKADIGNISALCEQLGNPHLKLKTIHIAGTNGKGSVSHLLASILAESGYKTGLFTSPHLLDFRERIRINGEMVSREFVIDFIEKNKNLIEEVQPSFFEITTAMAFLYFSQNKADIAVIETGLGGRLDATNIITPLLSVITNISFDHEYLLGNSLAKIAFEKAGIIKEGVPVVIGESHPETQFVFQETAKEKNAALYFADREYSAEIVSRLAGHTLFNLKRNSDESVLPIDCGLAGDCQQKNLATVLKIIDILEEKAIFISKEKIKEGCRLVKERTGLQGRWDQLGFDPAIICDISHNPAAIEETVKQLNNCSFEKIHIVFGLSADKNLGGILALLPENAAYYFCRPSVPRGLDEQLLQNEAAAFGLKGKAFNTVEKALNEAIREAGKGDLILISGSAFVVSDAMKLLPEE